MPDPLPLLPTTLVGSYPQPEWLIDREKLAARLPPRVRATDLWRIDPAYLKDAQDDATLLAIRDQERAGLDIITDGEIRRESYSNRFALALDGIDADNPGSMPDRLGNPMPVPRVIGPVRRREQILVQDVEFLRANTDRTIKITVPGPFTMAQQAQDEHYGSEEERRVRVRRRGPRGGRRPVRGRRRHRPARRAVDGGPRRAARSSASRRCAARWTAWTARPRCTSASATRSFMGGRTTPRTTSSPSWRRARRPDLDRDGPVRPRSRGARAARGQVDHPRRARAGHGRRRVARDRRGADPARAAAQDPQELVVAPDCGMKYLPREAAYAKLQALVAGAEAVRAEVGAAVR